MIFELIKRKAKRWLLRLTERPITVNGADCLYIHFPFCKRPCRFCSFVRYPYNEELANAYYKKILQDLELLYSRGLDFKTVYIGGGSPSANALIGDVIDSLYEKWKPEISVEVNPIDVLSGALDLIDEMEVRRLSMGVQSLSQRILSKLGRGVSADETRRALEILKEKKYKTVNLDLIWGVERGDWRRLKEEIETLKKYGNQITLYPLMPFPLNELEGFIIYKRSICNERLCNAWTICEGEGLVDEYIVSVPSFLGIGVSAISFTPPYSAIHTFNVREYLKTDPQRPRFSALLSKTEIEEFTFAMQLHSLKIKAVPKRYKIILPLIAKKENGVWNVKGCLGKYLGVVALRELYTALGEFRKTLRGVEPGPGFEPGKNRVSAMGGPLFTAARPLRPLGHPGPCPTT